MHKQGEQGNDIYQKIIKQTNNLYQTAYISKHKKQPIPDSTVISSFSLHNKLTQTLQIVSVGFGTKSLPYSLFKKNKKKEKKESQQQQQEKEQGQLQEQNKNQYKGKVVKDMHAEVLARRGFIRYILEKLPKRGVEGKEKVEGEQQNKGMNTDLFLWDEKRGKHYLRDQIPCGDCMTDQHTNLYSGSRPLTHFPTQHPPPQKFQPNILRTKPGRLDLPIQNRSLSLSCSDKIMVWNVLGVQGKVLFNYVRPIYVSAILVESGYVVREGRIGEGVDLLGRLRGILGEGRGDVGRVMGKLLKIRVEGKCKYITKQFRCNKPKIIFIPKPNQQQPNKNNQNEPNPAQINQTQTQKSDLCGIITPTRTSWLNGRTGLPQGVSLKKMNKISQFCSDKLYENCGSRQERQEEEFKYHAVKGRIKMLFGEWTDQYK